MLGLGVGFYRVGGDMDVKGSWLPTDESSLKAWYQMGTGITDLKPGVSLWTDSGGTSAYNMVQGTGGNQAAYNTVTKAVTFDGTDDFLQMAGQISIAAEFTVGIKFNSTTTGRVLLGDNTEANEMFKIMDSNTLRLKTSNQTSSSASSTVNMDMSDGSTFGDSYIVVTRDGSNEVIIWHNGVEQTPASTQTLQYTMEIDAMGVRNGPTNYWDGDIYDVVMFTAKNDTLTANVNNYLGAL